MSIGGFLLISLACLKISIGDKGSKVIFLSLCMKVYVLVLHYYIISFLRRAFWINQGRHPKRLGSKVTVNQTIFRGVLDARLG